MKSSDLPASRAVAIWQNSDLFAMGRLRGNDGQYITQATLTSITVYVYDTSDGDAQTYTGTLSVASTVSDTLVTNDPRWTEDALGYNFGGVVPASAFPAGAHEYRVEVFFNPTSGGRFPLVLEVSTLPLKTPNV